ncbi:MAG TPA: hypothetical protein VFE73_04070 [Reyranella sp.]|jgi:hypothetical protein|nr:hypothetical protein [Reyranella sp.]
MRMLAVLLTGVAVNAAAADMTSPLVEHVRAANARFAEASAATAEGYTAIPCVDGPDGAVTGVRYVNQRYFKDEVPAIGRPQALTYEPGDDGRLTLVAVEYITFKGPARLENQPYRLVAAPNRFGRTPFYDLLVWTGRPISDALICSAMYFE